MRAQHDTMAENLLALLNREAHGIAARGASTPTPWAVPLPHLLQVALVLHYLGALLLEPQLGLDQGGGAKKIRGITVFFEPLPPRGGTARKKISHPYV